MTRLAWIGAFGTTGAVTLLSLVSSILVARGLGPDGRGLLLVLTVWPAILAGIFSLSVNEATAYHVAKSSRQGSDDGSGGYAAAGFVLQGAIALVATGLTVGAVALLQTDDKRSHLGIVIAYAAAFTPLMLMDLYFKAVLQGRGAHKALNLTRLSQPLVYMMLLVGIMLMGGLAVEAVMVMIIASMTISLSIGAFSAGSGRLSELDRGMIAETFATAWKFHLGNLLLASGAWVERILIVRLYDDTNAGYYAVAVALAALGAGLVVPSLVISLTRAMPAAASASDQAEVLRKHADIGAVAVLAVNGGAAALAPWWLPFIFGGSFAPAVPAVMIFFLTGVLLSQRQLIDRALRSAHVAWIGVAGEAVALAALVPCALLGTWAAGLTGFAAGLAVAQMLALAVVVVLTSRTLPLKSLDLVSFGPSTIARVARSLKGVLAGVAGSERK